MTKDNNLTTGSISRLIAKLAIPASIGYFFNTMYNIVDTFFGGLISTQVLAALSLSLPVFFIIIVSFLFHNVKVTHKKRGIILFNYVNLV
jgi:Na+-driven multidrug efflux pump